MKSSWLGEWKDAVSDRPERILSHVALRYVSVGRGGNVGNPDSLINTVMDFFCTLWWGRCGQKSDGIVGTKSDNGLGSRHLVCPEKNQLPTVMVGIVTDDIKAVVITDKLEISVIRCQPAILDGNDADVACSHRQSPRRLFVPVAGIAIDLDIHLPAGHDNS